MKKFLFALQKVLDLREGIETNEKNKLSLLYLEQSELFRQRDIIEQLFQENRIRQQQAYSEGVSINSLKFYTDFFDKIESQAKENLVALNELDVKIAQQISIVLQATQDKEILLKLREKQYGEYTELMRKAEEKFIEEFVSYQMITNPA